ncbi:MAG TPA: DUF29 domain-containing protein [Methylomirabilota bacterium]|jgi:hypothetical protein|nr:DUF29 domain-containing protein [Methylomirabilota bacterium]
MAAPVVKPRLGEDDYHAWLIEQAAHLRARRFDKLDAEAIAEELEDMGRGERRAIESHLKNLLLHLLKWSRQAKRRSGSWRDSIDTARDAIADLLDDSPSLRPYLSEFVERQYPRARRSAANQTGLAATNFPPVCPFTLAQILDYEFFPE